MENRPLTAQSVVLASGGARGITARCVIHLAQHTSCKFILLGRTHIGCPLPEWMREDLAETEIKQRIVTDLAGQGQKPTPQVVSKQYRTLLAQKDIEATLSALRQAGSDVEYVDADITAPLDELQNRLAAPVRRLGPIRGVIHGAGVLADRRIEKLTAADFDTVLSPKVAGLQKLLQIAPASQLDFLVLFSSVVGFFGNVGQSDYAMANEVLNKAAYQIKRDNPSCHVVSINWGPWDSGMVTPELKRAFAERSMSLIPTDAGAELMVREITSNRRSSDQPVQIVVGDLPSRPASELSERLQHYQITRRLSLDANPFLSDHRIGQKPVLPATCAASWLASSCEQLYPGFTFHLIEDFKVLKGIVFDETLAGEYTLDLEETEKIPGERVGFSGRVWSRNKNGRQMFHYSFNSVLQSRIPHSPVHALPIELFAGQHHPISGKLLYQNGTLFHGPSFQGVKRVLSMSPTHVAMECCLEPVSADQQGQFPLQTSNPFIYDAIVQSLLIWSQYQYQAPCLPSYLKKLEHYKTIPFGETCLVDLRIVSHSSSSVTADIWVTDGAGEVYAVFHGLRGTISLALNRLIGSKTGENAAGSGL